MIIVGFLALIFLGIVGLAVLFGGAVSLGDRGAVPVVAFLIIFLAFIAAIISEKD
jgi:hypothetical protein